MLIHSVATKMSEFSPQDAPNNVVDAARDLMYCPQDPPSVPRAAPRGNPPTPKPRSGKMDACHYAKCFMNVV